MGYRCGECGTKGLMCVCIERGFRQRRMVTSTRAQPLRLNLLVVSKYLCREGQVVIFRIVLHTRYQAWLYDI